MPQPGYVNTPYGPVPISQIGKGPTFSSGTAKTFKPGQVVGGYIDFTTGLCKPIIPNPVVATVKTGGNNGNAGGTNGNNITKTANSDIFEAELSRSSSVSLEESIAFMALTTNEILEISRSFNMSIDSKNLNKNLLDATDTINAINPVQLIKMQNNNTEYLASSTRSVENTAASINSSTGESAIVFPSTIVLSSSTPSAAAGSTVNSSSVTPPPQVRVEVQQPAQVVPQTTTPPHRIISINKTSAKRGDQITVNHERCTQDGAVVRLGTINRTFTNRSSTTFRISIPTAVSGSGSVAIGSQYKISVTINGVTVTSEQAITIIA